MKLGQATKTQNQCKPEKYFAYNNLTSKLEVVFYFSVQISPENDLQAYVTAWASSHMRKTSKESKIYRRIHENS